MIQTKSNLLIFDKRDKMGNIFSKDCTVFIPDYVPVTCPDHTSSIGMVTSHDRDGSRIEIQTIINNYKDEEELKKAIEYGTVYSYGFYRINKIHKENELRVFDDITLIAVGLSFYDVFGNNDLRMEVME